MRPHLDQLLAEPDLARGLNDFAAVLLEAILSPAVVAMRRLVAAESGRFPDIAELYLQTSWQANIDALSDTLGQIEHRRDLVLDDATIAAEQLVWMIVGPPLNARTLGDATPTDHTARQRVTHAVDTFLARYAT